MNKKLIITIKGTTLTLIFLLTITGCLTYNIQDRYRRYKFGVPAGVYLGDILVERMFEDEVEALVNSLNREILTKPRNAYLDSYTGQTLAEGYGKKIDVTATVKLIMNSEPHTVHQPFYITLDPEITEEVYKNINTKIGSYSTWFGGGNRGENIRIATYAINNSIVAPGDIFSFNDATKPRTPERGYKLAPIIVGGSVVPGYGGGICQVSTTLYNAVLNANLEVVERYPHSMPVDYVPPGKDATVSDYLDFKFRNNSNRFVLIKASAYNPLIVELWH
ncbi:MAG: VanW family protein [Dethiobacteria bacterium]